MNQWEFQGILIALGAVLLFSFAVTVTTWVVWKRRCRQEALEAIRVTIPSALQRVREVVFRDGVAPHRAEHFRRLQEQFFALRDSCLGQRSWLRVIGDIRVIESELNYLELECGRDYYFTRHHADGPVIRSV